MPAIHRQSMPHRASCEVPHVLPARQRGQASVFVVVLIVVVLIGVLVLFNSGQLTRQKMELQNAADAAAYSTAILRVRAMNFMAYTNRAMVANEMAIGQFSAFASWRKKYQVGSIGNTPSMLAVVATLDALGAWVGITIGQYFKQIVTAPLKVFNQVNRIIGGAGYGLSQFFIPANFAVNAIYSAFQWTMRVGTMLAQVESVPKIIRANAPDAHLSNFGALAAVLSLAEHEQFLAFAGPEIAADRYPNAIPRYLALVNDSRDAWTRDRRRTDLATPPLNTDIIRTGLLNVSLSDVAFGYPIRGGTELRYAKDDEDDPGWSSADTVGFGLTGTLNVEICLPLVDCTDTDIPLGALQISLAGAVQENVLAGGATLGRGRVDEWGDGLGPDGLYGHAQWDTPLAFTDAVIMGYQKKGRYYGPAHYHFINPDEYGGGQNPPVILVGVRKELADLATSDQLPAPRRLGAGRFQLDTLITGANEGEVGGLVEAELQRQLSARLQELLPGDLLAPPPPVDNYIDVASIVDNLAAEVVGPLRPAIDKLVAPLNLNRGKPAMFALAAARIYYKNPEDDSELGSLFNPYWEVRLQAVDDNVRKWSLITQDRRFNQIVSYLSAGDIDPEETGIRGGLERLEDYAN